ncbi:MAG: hypothetical protein ACLTCP_09780 [Ruminococcus bicirculans (ex Wegman et al. 2014)]
MKGAEDKGKAGELFEKGKEKLTFAESEKGQKIKSKAGELFEKGKEKPTSSQRAKRAKR